MPPSAATPELRSSFRQLVAEGRQASEFLERGQAQQPLQEHFTSIDSGLDAASPGVILLSADLGGWAVGALCDSALKDLRLPVAAGPIAVRFQESGWALKEGLAVREFDQPQGLLEALAALSAARAGDCASVRSKPPVELRLAGPPELCGLRVWVVGDAAEFLDDPGVLTRMDATSNLLVVVADATRDLTDIERLAVEEIALTVDAIVPVVVTKDETPGPGQATGPPWWSAAARAPRCVLLEPAFVARSDATAALRAVIHPHGSIREALLFAHHARRLRAAADMASDCHQRELRRLTARHAELQRLLKSCDETSRENDVRSEVESIRAEFQGELAKLSAGITELNRKAMLPSGSLLVDIEDALDQLEPDDLEGTPSGKVIRISIQDESLERISHRLKQTLRRRLHEDMVFLRDGIELLEEEAAERLSALRPGSASVSLAVPDEDEIWDIITEMVSLDIRYRGEMPRRGFLQRLVEGRRQVYMILMSISLFGGAFGVGRSSALMRNLFLGLFLCGVAYTFLAWKREDRYRIDKELDRVKDTLGSEVRRILSEVNREKLSRISSALSDLAREALRSIDLAAKEALTERTRNLDREKQRLRARIQNVEKRKREGQAQGQFFSRLKSRSAELERACQKLLPEAIQQVPQPT